jgi:hypothetical protein
MLASTDVDRTGPITLIAARSAGLQVNDMPDAHTANENDTLIQNSGDSDTV